MKQRRCRFGNETDEKKYKNINVDRKENAYRRSTCVRACRLESIVTLCRCVPVYFDEIFRQRTNSKMCSFEDLPCLSRYAGISCFFSIQIYTKAVYERGNWCSSSFVCHRFHTRISLFTKKSVETSFLFVFLFFAKING